MLARPDDQRVKAMNDDRGTGPDATAVRVSLWRAMHAEADPLPHILDDTIGLRLINPDENWRQRPDMDPQTTAGYRAGVVARARFVEDLLFEQAGRGVTQYVLLGAGLDTFAQRRPDIAASMRIFEVDRPAPQAWKRQRLIATGFGAPEWLNLVAVDFESGQSWWDALLASGFDAGRPAVVASTGVSMYLTGNANLATLRQIARLAPGSTLAMTFLLPLDLIAPATRAEHQALHDRATAAGTPFLSFFRPSEIIAMAHDAGFREATCTSGEDLTQRYFSGRADGLRPAIGESFLVARVR